MTHPTAKERAEILHRYTHRGQTINTIAADFQRHHATISRIITNAGHGLRPPGRTPIDPALHQPNIAYCALCEQKALYVFTDIHGGGGVHDGGHILEIDPHPKGRWVDRGDGIYQRRKTLPPDGSGHRPHSCGKHHPGRRAHDQARNPR